MFEYYINYLFLMFLCIKHVKISAFILLKLSKPEVNFLMAIFSNSDKFLRLKVQITILNSDAS
jgi:hypothetical protein